MGKTQDWQEQEKSNWWEPHKFDWDKKCWSPNEAPAAVAAPAPIAAEPASVCSTEEMQLAEPPEDKQQVLIFQQAKLLK